jgi:GT2 family glycosyltransferase
MAVEQENDIVVSNPAEDYSTQLTPGLVSIGIINYNSGHYIFRALDHLLSQTYQSIEIIVVDNASSDGSESRLATLARAGQLSYLRLRENVGFSRANNIAIRASHGEFFLALNADAFLAADYIENCIRLLGSDRQIGMVGGKLLSDRDPRIIDSAGTLISKEGLAIERGNGAPDFGQFDTPCEIVGVCAAAALYRREMLEDIKQCGEYFDEDFFAYHEDVDLCVRSILQGWKIWYCPSAAATHVRGGSTSGMSREALYLNWRNNSYLYFKTWRRPIRCWNPLLPLSVLAVYWASTCRQGIHFQMQIVRDLLRVRKKLRNKRRERSREYKYSELDRLTSASFLSQFARARLKKCLRLDLAKPESDRRYR